MTTLTIHCRYPNDDELTCVAYTFANRDEAMTARGAVRDLVAAGGVLYLPDDDVGLGPIPFHTETVWMLTVDCRQEGGAEFTKLPTAQEE